MLSFSYTVTFSVLFHVVCASSDATKTALKLIPTKWKGAVILSCRFEIQWLADKRELWMKDHQCIQSTIN